VEGHGRKFSLSCVGYGEPQLPDIMWTAQGPDGLVNLNDPEGGLGFRVNINNTIVEDSDSELAFIVSILELCYTNYMIYEAYTDFQCHALLTNVTEPSTIGKSYSDPISLIPLGKKCHILLKVVV